MILNSPPRGSWPTRDSRSAGSISAAPSRQPSGPGRGTEPYSLSVSLGSSSTGLIQHAPYRTGHAEADCAPASMFGDVRTDRDRDERQTLQIASDSALS